MPQGSELAPCELIVVADGEARGVKMMGEREKEELRMQSCQVACDSRDPILAGYLPLLYRHSPPPPHLTEKIGNIG